MRGKYALSVALLIAATSAAAAGPLENMLAKLAPDERAHQACILKGFDVLKRDARLRKVDRMKTSIFNRAVLDGTNLRAPGGAVRLGTHWYAMNFSCHLTPDLMKATTFSFTLGAPIPQANWERLGLWS